MSQPVELPYTQLDPEMLRRLLEEITSRGEFATDMSESWLEARVSEALKHLKSGEAALFFDPESESFNLVARDQIPEGEGG